MSVAEKWDSGDSRNEESDRNLSRHYRTVGSELLRLERMLARLDRDMGRVQLEFRVATALVATEILESYLDDLLDRSVADEALSICREGSKVREIWIPVGGLMASIACGLYASTFGVSMFWSLLLTVVLALPFALLLSLVPQGGLARRMMFAQIVSHEVLRRRGRANGQLTPINAQEGSVFVWQRIALEGSGGSSRVASPL